MKKILCFLACCFSCCFFFKMAFSQTTYQTALRIGYLGVNFKDSTTTVQPGVDMGCLPTSSQPTWGILAFCESGSINCEITVDKYVWNGIDSFGLVVYGPFSDTTNMAGKLTSINIDTCKSYIQASNIPINFSLYIPNYQRGDIYYMLATSSTNIYRLNYNMQTFPGINGDTNFCWLCNSRVSDLYQNICTVGYDSAAQKNKIIWSKDIYTPAKDYVFFRQNANLLYDTLGFQPVSQLSEYIDVTSSPQAKSYKYKVSIRDSCGQFSNKPNLLFSNYPSFTTMHLVAYPSGNNAAGLIWNIGSFYGPFLIYRTDQNGNSTLIDSVAYQQGSTTLTYTDINAPAGYTSYQIGVRLSSACVSSLVAGYSIVKSNPANVIVTSTGNVTDISYSILVRPNPFDQFAEIDLSILKNEKVDIVIKDINGKCIRYWNDFSGDMLIFEKENASSGVYFIEITGEQFMGRKKLMVQ